MKLFVFALLLVAGVAFAREDASARLAGGTPTLPGHYPSVVSIDSPYNVHCVGNIVNLQHVLTSAWCAMHPTTFTLINPFWLRVIAGDVNLITPTIRREVRSVSHLFVHPNYNRLSGNNDLAVMRVSSPFPQFHNTIEPAILNTRIWPDNTQCFFAGWGANTAAANAPLNPVQRVVTVPTLGTGQCNVPAVHNNRVLGTMICAGSIPATANTVCQGNQGGAMFCGGHLTGVLTFGFACGGANQPGVYIDVRQYRQWIDTQFTRTDNPPPGWVPTPL